MNRLRIALLALLLGLPAAAAADDSEWGTLPSRSAPPPPAAGQFGRPVVAQTPPAPAAAPAAMLERPRSLSSAAPPADSQVQLVSFEPVFPGQFPDAGALPSGSTPSADTPLFAQYRQRTTPDQVVAAPIGLAGPQPDAAAMPAGCCPFDGGCDAPCDDTRLWVRGEYLLWWTKSVPVPTPLVTSAPPTALGLLGEPTTTVLLGQSSLGQDFHSGVRVEAGGWFDCDHTVGLEGGYFFLGRQTNRQSIQSSGPPGSPVLSVPVFNSDPAVASEVTYVLAFPGTLSGGATLTTSTQLQGADVNGLFNLANTGRFRLDLLGGFRYLRLQEDLNFSTNLLNGPATAAFGPNFAGGFANTVDDFNTTNNFYGGQLGLHGEYHWNRFSVDATGKVALGGVNEVTAISGSTFSNLVNDLVAVPARTTAGGIFAQPTNIGNHSQNKFAVAPEVDFTLGYQVTDRVRLTAGYDFLYISQVARPGNEIDRNVNFSQSPVQAFGALNGPARPAFPGNSTDFWAQGVHVGLEFRY